MSEFDEDFEDENDEDGNTGKQPLDKNIRLRLRQADKEAKELAQLRVELEAERESKLYDKAGVPEDGLGEMFRKGYTGDKTVEAIRQKAVDIGLLNKTRESNETLNDSELEALRRTQGATTGGDGNAPDAEQLYLAALDAATTPEETMKAVADFGAKVNVLPVGTL
jgi:hypothetical protein